VPSIALLSIFTVSLMHALIPSHWLCFVVVGRAQGWKTRKTMTVAAIAGLLHVATTVGAGIGLSLLGRRAFDGEHLERIGGVLLIGLGLFYLVLHFLHAGHHHDHDNRITEHIALAALLFSLTLSPCSAIITLLIAAAGSVGQVALIAGVLLVTTVGMMLLLIGLTSLGIEKLKLTAVEHYEKLIVGLVVAGLGVVLLLLHHHE